MMSYQNRLATALLAALLTSSAASAVDWEGEALGKAGLGYDSNAYLAPDKGYFDPFSGTDVDPDKKAGWFIPYELEAGGSASWGDISWPSDAKIKGRSYADSDLANADTYRLSADTGIETVLKRRGVRENSLYVGASVDHVKKIYFDRDSGLEKETSTTAESLSDRYVYTSYGAEARLNMRTGSPKYQLNAGAKRYDYEEVPLLSSLDYDLLFLGGEVQGNPLKNTKVSLGYDFSLRNYSDRLARDEDGNQLAGNDKLRYDYHDLALGLTQRLGENWRLYLEYDLKLRKDQFVGYNDYTRHRFGLRGKYKDDAGRLLALGLSYWQRRYPNAYAFDDPAYDKKSYKTWDFNIDGELPLSKVWKLWMENELRLQNCTDPRYEYDHYQIVAGIAAEF